MITEIRKLFKTKAYKVALWIIIIAMAITFSPSILREGKKAQWAVQVNGEQISNLDFMRKAAGYQELISMVRAQFGKDADMWLESRGLSSDPNAVAMNDVIQESLLNQAAKRLGLSVGQEYINEKLSNPGYVQMKLMDIIPPAILNEHGGINEPMLKVYLQRMGMSRKDFDEKVREKFERDLVTESIQNAAYLPQFEIKEFYISNFAPKKYSLLRLPFDKAIQEERKTAISPEELKNYFETQNTTARRYWVPEKRVITVWRIEPQNFGVSVSEKEVENYYEKNKNTNYIQEPSKIEVRQIIFKVPSEAERASVYETAKKTREDLLKAPNTFAQVASSVSQDKESASNGGLIAPFARGEKERTFDKAAFILNKDGDISDVVQTPDGYAIIQRVRKISPVYKPLESVKKEIEQQLLQPKFMNTFTQEMRKLIEASKNEPGKLEKELQAKEAKSFQLPGVARDNKEWGATAFGLQKIGDVTFFIDKDKGVVVRLDEIQKEHLPTLESMKSVVANDIYEERATRAIESKLQELRTQAATRSLRELQLASGGDIEQTDWLTFDNNDALTALKRKGYPVEQLLQLEKVGSVNTTVEDKNGFIARLEEIQPFNEEQFNAKKEEIIRGVLTQEKRLYLAGFVASLYRSAKIEKNESLDTITEDYSQYYEE